MRNKVPITDLTHLSELLSSALTGGTCLTKYLAPQLNKRLLSADALYLHDRPLDVANLGSLQSGGLRKKSAINNSLFLWIAELALEELALEENSICIIENRYAKRGDKNLDRFAVSPIFMQNEVYFQFKKGADVKIIADTIKKSSALPHFATVITKINKISTEWSEIDLGNFASATERVFLFAYDGEGFLDIRLSIH